MEKNGGVRKKFAISFTLFSPSFRGGKYGKTFISELSKGQTVESMFLVRDKILAKTKSGNPYLSIKLADRTGERRGESGIMLWIFSPV